MGALAVLTVLRNGETVKQQTIEGEISLGRGEGNVIRLEDRAVSRQHAIFRRSGDGVQVEKRSEFAPINVNGAECARALLKDGDVISIGPYLLRLSVQKQAQALPPAPLPEPPVAVAPPPEAPAPAVEEEILPEAEVLIEAAAEPAEEAAFEAGPDLAMGGPLEGAEPPSDFSGVDEDGKTKLTPIAGLSVQLVFRPGEASVGEVLDLTKDEISIGRGKGCDVVLLTDKKSSRKHAIVRRAGASFLIKDLASANGTFVNGVKIDEHELAGEDTIRIGDVEFQFRAMSADYMQREAGFMQLPPEEAPPEEPAFQDGDDSGMGGLPTDPSALADLSGLPVVGLSGQELMPGVELGAIPGIAGLPGVGAAAGKKPSLMEKFRALPPKKQAIYGVVALAFFYYLAFDEPQEEVKKTKAKSAQKATAPTGPLTFESMTPEQKRFIEAQHALAFDHYKNKDYDKAIYEVQRIFSLIPDFKDSKEIERYAKEGKRKLEAIEEEKQRKEEETRLKAKIQELVDECAGKMAKKDFVGAQALFSDILSIDPDNVKIGTWKKEIEEHEEAIKLAQTQKDVQLQINKKAWEIYQEAMELKKKGRCHEAFEVFPKVGDVGASDPKPAKLAQAGIVACKSYIRSRRDPVLAEAKAAESNGEQAKAFQLYKKATLIDPPHPAGYAGMARIRETLHLRSKALYTEAVLLESFSDYDSARKKFKEVLANAPEDDIYHERATRKLRLLAVKKEEGPPQ